MNPSTEINLHNTVNRQYFIRVTWIADLDGHGWKGKCEIWKEHIKISDGHEISLRQTKPLGMIAISLDQCNVGAWASYSFDGHGLNERDFFWASIWAASVIEAKHKEYKTCKCGVKE